VRRLAWLLLLASCSKASAPAAETVEASVPDPFLAPAVSAEPSAPAASGSPFSAPAASSVGASTPAPHSSVQLLDAGHEPLRPLRYAWRADQKELMDIDLRTAVTTELGSSRQDTALPPLHIAVAIEGRSVSPDGDLRFAWHVESAKAAAPEGGTADAVTQGWRMQLVPVEHLSGTGGVTAHGISQGVTLDAGTAGDAGPEAEMVVQVLQMLRDMAAPLPDEPVGKGARWQKRSTLDARNGHATQTDTYTLLDAPGDKGALDDVFAQTASPQNLPSPVGVSSDSPARVDSLLTSGSSKVHFDLARLVAPVTLDGTTSMALSGPSNRMNMVMRLGIVVKGTTASGAPFGPSARASAGPQ
jgi:hypothetical protein